MFKKIEPLTKENHQDIRFTSMPNFSFAQKVSKTPISFSEFLHASRYYPIVFLKESALPVVLFSLDQNQNNFINPDGSWKVPYVPAHLRQYPFVLVKAAISPDAQETASKDGSEKTPSQKESDGKKALLNTPESQERYVVCIDRDAPHFASSQGDIMFTANGEFTEMTQKAVAFLKLYQQEMSVTSSIVKLMEDKDILAEREFHVSVNGQNRAVGGFRTVDMKRLNSLEDAVLAEWVRKGIIALIFSHVNSLSGMKIS